MMIMLNESFINLCKEKHINYQQFLHNYQRFNFGKKVLFSKNELFIRQRKSWIIIIESQNLTIKEINCLLKLVDENNKITNDLLKQFFSLYKKCFGIVFLNIETEEMFLIRDYIGYYSLYYYVSDNVFFVCDDLSFISSFFPDIKINSSYIYHSLTLFFSEPTTTIYESIKEVSPGSIVNITTDKTIRTTKYYSFRELLGDNFYEEEEIAIKKIKSSLKKTCRKYEHRVFSLLSGGIDSGIVNALLKENNNEVFAITVDYEDNILSEEIQNATKMAQSLGIKNHHILKITNNEIVEIFNKMLDKKYTPIFTLDAVLVEFVCDYIKRTEVVCPNICFLGDGADEIGGYKSYIDMRKEWGELCDFYNLPAKDKHKMLSDENIAKYEIALNSYPIPRKFVQAFSEYEKTFFWKNITPPSLSYDIVSQFFIKNNNLDFLKNIQNIEFSLRLPEFYFRRQWRQYNESKIIPVFPFLENDILEYCLRLSPELYMKNDIAKYLFKKIHKQYYSDITISSKTGFGSILSNFYSNYLPELVYYEIDKNNRLINKFFDIDYIRCLLENEGCDNGFKLWIIYAIIKWMEKQRGV